MGEGLPFQLERQQVRSQCFALGRLGQVIQRFDGGARLASDVAMALCAFLRICLFSVVALLGLDVRVHTLCVAELFLF